MRREEIGFERGASSTDSSSSSPSLSPDQSPPSRPVQSPAGGSPSVPSVFVLPARGEGIYEPLLDTEYSDSGSSGSGKTLDVIEKGQRPRGFSTESAHGFARSSFFCERVAQSAAGKCLFSILASVPPALLLSASSGFWVANSFGVWIFETGSHQQIKDYLFSGAAISFSIFASAVLYGSYFRFSGRVSNYHDDGVLRLCAVSTGASFGSFAMRTILELAKSQKANLNLGLTFCAALASAGLRFYARAPLQTSAEEAVEKSERGVAAYKKIFSTVFHSRAGGVAIATGMAASAGLIAWRSYTQELARKDFHEWTSLRIVIGVLSGAVGGVARFYKDSNPRLEHYWKKVESFSACTSINLIGAIGLVLFFNNMKAPNQFDILSYFLLVFSMLCASVLPSCTDFESTTPENKLRGAATLS